MIIIFGSYHLGMRFEKWFLNMAWKMYLCKWHDATCEVMPEVWLSFKFAQMFHENNFAKNHFHRCSGIRSGCGFARFLFFVNIRIWVE